MIIKSRVYGDNHNFEFGKQKRNTCTAGRCTLADVMTSHDLTHKLTQNTYNYVAKMKKHDNTIFLMITLMQLDHYTYLT